MGGGRVKGKWSDQSGQRRKMLARESAVEQKCDRETKEGGGEKKEE